MTGGQEGPATTARVRAQLRRVREALRSVDRRDSAAVAELLDPVASAAASGSIEAVELVVWAVDELGLARPAIRRILVNDAEVDDVAQDVLVAVAETIQRYRGEARFTTWLHQVARFKAIAHLRRSRPHAALPEQGDAQRISSMIATRASVAEILETLPERYRAPVVLRDVEQLTYDEVATRRPSSEPAWPRSTPRPTSGRPAPWWSGSCWTGPPTTADGTRSWRSRDGRPPSPGLWREGWPRIRPSASTALPAGSQRSGKQCCPPL